MNSENSTRRLCSWIIRRQGWLFLTGLALALGAGFIGRELQMDRSIQRMFAADDPILSPYRHLQETFEQHEIVLAVYSDPQLRSEAGLQRLGRLVQQIRAVPGVVAAVSLLDPPQAADFEDDSRGEMLREVFAGYTHNKQLDAGGIVCLLAKPIQESAARSDTLRQLRALLNEHPDGTLVGEPVLVEEAFDLLEADGRRLNTWCTVLLLLTIFVCFRQSRWLVLPLVVVQMTLALTRGLLVSLGLQLSMVSSMLAAIVTVVGVATIVHVIVRFRDAQSAGLPAQEALTKAIDILAVPIFFACLTDAAGFAALMSSSVGPVQDFGLMMALGCLMVLVSVFLAVPAIVLFGKPGSARTSTTDETKLRNSLDRLLGWSIRQTRGLLVFGGIACVFAALGSMRLVRETDFTRNFRQDSQLVRGYQFVENQFGGAGVWDILIAAPRTLNIQFVQNVLAFEEQLRANVPQLTKVMSISGILDAGSGGLPKSGFGARLAIRAGLGLMRSRMPEFVDAIYYPGSKESQPQLRILLRAPETLAAAEKTQLIEQVRREAKAAFPGAQVTGYYVLLTQLIESLLRDQWTTFGLAGFVILAMMVVAFRSVDLALAALVPNALPVLVLFGTMGWLGVRVNMGAAMIAAVSLGLSVDGSIHYIMSYQRARREGFSVDDALRSVQATVGRAAAFATLALVVGFATLCFSEFVPTIYFGALVSLSMIGGLVGNLMVLPVLIRLLR